MKDYYTKVEKALSNKSVSDLDKAHERWAKSHHPHKEKIMDAIKRLANKKRRLARIDDFLAYCA